MLSFSGVNKYARDKALVIFYANTWEYNIHKKLSFFSFLVKNDYFTS